MLTALVFVLLIESSMLTTAHDPGCAVAAEFKGTCSNQHVSLLQIGQSGESLSSSRSNSLDVAMKPRSRSNILYVIRTWHKNYDTRVPSIMKTWASTLDRSSLLLVGDVDLQNPIVHAATGCSSDHHVGLTCKTGHSLALAADMIGNHPWAFLIDDDVYVNTSHLENVLKKEDPSKLVAFGIPGCGTPHCDDHEGGFCGGGGYALSRAALKALVDKPTAREFHNELLDMTKVFYPGETPWDDITTTCLMKRRGIEIKKMDGLYGWRLPDSSQAAPDGNLSPNYKGAIHSLNPAPLTFHYITPEEMYTIHSQFMKSEREKLSLLSIGASYAEQVKQHIHQEHLRRRAAA